MTVIGVGDLQMASGEKFPGIVIEASRKELQAIAGNILYKEVEVVSAHREDATGENGNFWDGKFAEMVDALCAIDKRVREAKPSPILQNGMRRQSDAASERRAVGKDGDGGNGDVRRMLG